MAWLPKPHRAGAGAGGRVLSPRAALGKDGLGWGRGLNAPSGAALQGKGMPVGDERARGEGVAVRGLGKHTRSGSQSREEVGAFDHSRNLSERGML